MSRVAELRALLDKATPGPWETSETQEDVPVIYARLQPPDLGVSVLFEADWGTAADAALIAAAPEALTLLLDVVEVAYRAARDTVDGLPYCGLCHWTVRHCDDHTGCWGTDLRAAIAHLEATP